jgi:hypothetical protein
MRLLGMVMLAIAHSEDVCELGDCQNGVGTLHFGNLGTRYEGSSHDRVQDSCRSSVVWDAGQWVDANHHGLGVYTWADGTVYAGVSCLSPSAQATACSAVQDRSNASAVAAGHIARIAWRLQEWSKNAMHGSGVLRSSSGSIFEGEWFNNTCTGYGASVSTDGETYEVPAPHPVWHLRPPFRSLVGVDSAPGL